jgi:hypothetical protein
LLPGGLPIARPPDVFNKVDIDHSKVARNRERQFALQQALSDVVITDAVVLVGTRGMSAVSAFETWRVDSDAKCNPVEGIGSSAKVGFSIWNTGARFAGDKDGSARRKIEPLH